MELKQETIPDEILDELYEARGRWQRMEWLITPRVMGEVAMGGCGIHEALDDYRAWRDAVADFERVFNPEAQNEL